MTTDFIEQLNGALSSARVKLQEMEGDYNRLRAQVAAYEHTLHNLKAIEAGDFDAIIEKTTVEEIPQVRKDSDALREHVFEFFKGRPRRVESPKGVSQWLIEQKSWSDDGLRPRVSNLLRKIVREEVWLNRAAHGKYQFVPSD